MSYAIYQHLAMHADLCLKYVSLVMKIGQKKLHQPELSHYFQYMVLWKRNLKEPRDYSDKSEVFASKSTSPG